MTKIVWDANPKVVVWRGLRIDVFYRTAVAKALNRQYGTIRKMERTGVLCKPKLTDSRKTNRRYYYTRDQIEDLITLAKEEGVMDPRPHYHFSDRFVREAHAIIGRSPSERSITHARD